MPSAPSACVQLHGKALVSATGDAILPWGLLKVRVRPVSVS
jgi:hypothetical protein